VEGLFPPVLVCDSRYCRPSFGWSGPEVMQRRHTNLQGSSVLVLDRGLRSPAGVRIRRGRSEGLGCPRRNK
jgi:hypothetical protein